MIKVLFLLVAFLVVVYVYTFIKLKKSKEKTKNIDTVKHFHDNYKHLTGVERANNNSSNTTTSYEKYVTKYNSTEDYREKN
ncbi:MAG: hypothetical protein J6B68_08125 [Lachnospiraceae bacterium]|nr:hypothetical protein [Lachnospiraceae bacterium]